MSIFLVSPTPKQIEWILLKLDTVVVLVYDLRMKEDSPGLRNIKGDNVLYILCGLN